MGWGGKSQLLNSPAEKQGFANSEGKSQRVKKTSQSRSRNTHNDHEFGRPGKRARGNVILIVKANMRVSRIVLKLFFENPQECI
jgi:hypothetical protein